MVVPPFFIQQFYRIICGASWVCENQISNHEEGGKIVFFPVTFHWRQRTSQSETTSACMSREIERNQSVIPTEITLPSQTHHHHTRGNQGMTNTTNSPDSGDDIFPSNLREVTKTRHPWCRIFKPSMNKKDGQQRLSRMILKILRFSWSFSTVFLVMLLTSLVIVGISLWLSNYFLIRRGVRQVANTQRDFLTLRVLNHLQDFVASGDRKSVV